MSIKYVQDWPKQVGGTWNPTPEQCREAGYELLANRPAADIAAEQAQQAAQAQEMADALAAHAAKVATNRAAYRVTTRALCREAGIAEVEVLTTEQIEATVLPLLEDSDSNAKIKRNVKAVAYLVKLLLLTMALKEGDGTDALDRI
jgi:hypothetical protein